MEAFKVPKQAAQVVLDLPPQGQVPRTIFLSSFAETHHGQETVSDILNRAGRFVPVLGEDSSPCLVSKSAIRWVKVVEPEPIEWFFYECRLGAPKLRVRLGFAEDDSLEGDIYAIRPEGQQRVSDVVNDGPQFLPLENEQGLYLVNLDRVTTILMVQEDHGGAG